MKLIFHIFKKDLRHHWPEVLISALLVCVYVWDQPRQWSARPSIRFAENLLEAVPVLVVLSWVCMAVRVVQSESLVGNRQFWLTRPYQWHVLLAAKALFMLVCLNLPLLIGQLILLKLALFPFAPALPGLLLFHAMTFLTFAVPSLALGSISRGFGTATIVVIGILVYVIGVVTVLSHFADTYFSPQILETAQELLCLGAAAAIIFIQYRYRRTRLSWKVLVACAIVVTFLAFLPAIPSATNRLLPGIAPNPSNLAKLSFDTSVYFKQPPGQSLELFADEVRAQFPIRIEDLDEESLLSTSAVKIELDLPTGERWTSRWQSWGEVVIPGRRRIWPSLEVKRKIVEQFGNSTISGRLYFLLDIHKIGPSSQMALTAGEFQLPGNVRCTANANLYSPSCFSVLRDLGPFLLRANLPTDTCQFLATKNVDDWAPSPAYSAHLHEDPLGDFDLTPIRVNRLTFTRLRGYEEARETLPVCRNSTFSIAATRRVSTTQIVVPLKNFRLVDFLPTYPPQLYPPFKHPRAQNPSDTLSLSLSPAPLNPRRNP